MEKVSLSNKVFTDNPLLDEIVYNARQIATGIVVKDYDLANKNETKESMLNGDTLVAIGNNTISFSNFYYDEEILANSEQKDLDGLYYAIVTNYVNGDSIASDEPDDTKKFSVNY